MYKVIAVSHEPDTVVVSLLSMALNATPRAIPCSSTEVSNCYEKGPLDLRTTREEEEFFSACVGSPSPTRLQMISDYRNDH
jgi:hypothetical protein